MAELAALSTSAAGGGRSECEKVSNNELASESAESDYVASGLAGCGCPKKI